MKRLMLAVLFLVFSSPAWGADTAPAPPQPSFEERKTEILKMMTDRMAAMEKEKKCVEAAKSHDDLMACREAQQAEMMKMRQKMPRSSGGPGPGPMGGAPQQ